MNSYSRRIAVKIVPFTLLALALFAGATRADVVTLKNGDRVTGAFVTVKDAKLQLKSDILGDLAIPVGQITSFAAGKPVVIVAKNQSPVKGQLELAPSGDWQITANGKPQTVAAASVELIMPADAYDALTNHTAKPWQDWKGNSTLGYSLQRGDQDTTNFAASVNAVRERPATPIFSKHFRTDFTLTTILSTATQGLDSVASKTISTNLREDYLFSPANFVFGFAQLDHVGAQGLYLRQTAGGGYGRTLINTSRANFSVLGGITYVHEKFFTGVHDQAPAALIGEKLGLQISKRVRLDHDLNFYPNLTSGGQYRFDTSTTLTANLSKRFSLNTGFTDLYLSNPAAGSQKNNIAFTTGIGYAF
jgi:putative salt-induced outer membrane protein YdiY